jgi:L-fuconolactonase
MRVDSHVHFWQYDKKEYDWISDEMEVLKQDYLPRTLASTLQRNGIDGCIAVQARQSELETHWLVELAKTNDIIKGVVGWIDLRSDDLGKRLEYFSQYHSIKGYRHVVQGEPDDFLLRKEFQKGVQALQPYGYTYDILIYHNQLKPATEFASRFPDQKFVIDHCAKPDIFNKKIDEWKQSMQEIAKHPLMYCKLSGLFTEARWKKWSPADFYPYLDVVFEAFGPDRLLFGSDWPVMLLSGMYVQWKSLLEKYMENFEEEDKEKIFGGNAMAFYGLTESS